MEFSLILIIFERFLNVMSIDLNSLHSRLDLLQNKALKLFVKVYDSHSDIVKCFA